MTRKEFLKLAGAEAILAALFPFSPLIPRPKKLSIRELVEQKWLALHRNMLRRLEREVFGRDTLMYKGVPINFEPETGPWIARWRWRHLDEIELAKPWKTITGSIVRRGEGIRCIE